MPRSSRDRRTDAAREQLRQVVPVTALARVQLASASAPRISYAVGVDPRQSPEVREHARSIDQLIRDQVDTMNRALAGQRDARDRAELVADGRPDLLVALVGEPVEGGAVQLLDWSVPVEVDPAVGPGRVLFVRTDRRGVLQDDPRLSDIPEPQRPEDFGPFIRAAAARLEDESGPLDPRANITITAQNETPATDRPPTE